jgi:hypothetical protein
MMPTTTPLGRETEIKLNPGQVPAFTAEDMRAYLEGRPECGLGPTVSGQPPTVESIEFATGREIRDRLHTSTGLLDDALACVVVLRGPFRPTRISGPPGYRGLQGVCEIAGEIYDASTGRLIVTSAGAFRSWREI